MVKFYALRVLFGEANHIFSRESRHLGENQSKSELHIAQQCP